jgi:hypothetical protein
MELGHWSFRRPSAPMGGGANGASTGCFVSFGGHPKLEVGVANQKGAWLTSGGRHQRGKALCEKRCYTAFRGSSTICASNNNRSAPVQASNRPFKFVVSSHHAVFFRYAQKGHIGVLHHHRPEIPFKVCEQNECRGMFYVDFSTRVAW